MSKYIDKIAITVAGHSHFSDLMFSEGYHNTLISPGLTPLRGNNPGYAILSVDTATLIPTNVEMTFLNLEETYDKKESQDLPLLNVNFKS